MFEVGVELNTSCLKKRDARVEQKMRGRPREGERETVLGVGFGGWMWGCWWGREKGDYEKNMHKERKIWKDMRLSIITGKQM